MRPSFGWIKSAVIWRSNSPLGRPRVAPETGPGEIEQGAAMISALASILGVDDEKKEDYDPQKLIRQIKDPVGTFYRYSLPASILHRKVIKK